MNTICEVNRSCLFTHHCILELLQPHAHGHGVAVEGEGRCGNMVLIQVDQQEAPCQNKQTDQ